MKLCTHDGVFKISTEDEEKNETGKVVETADENVKIGKRSPAEADRNIEDDPKFKKLGPTDVPCLRVIINLHKNNPAGIKYFRDSKGPLLAIQSFGEFEFLKEDEKEFISEALSMANKDWHGKLTRYEAHLCDKPAKDGAPFNPAYSGLAHDNDEDTFDKNAPKSQLPEFFASLSSK